MLNPSTLDLSLNASSDARAESYCDAVQGLAPLIAQHRDAFDKERRLPDPVFDAMAEAGLFRLWLPQKLGGPELSPLEFMRVVEAAAALDGSVGWLVGNGGGMSRAGGYLPARTARTIFADPHAFVVAATGAIGILVLSEGGYRLSGRWPFGSGAAHATHFMGLASVKDQDGREQPPLCCYVDRCDVTVHDTWHVSGLRGTGSSDFEVRDVFVPAERTHSFLEASAAAPSLVCRMPPVSIFAWTVSVVPLGIARGVLNAFVTLAGRKSSPGQRGLLRDREMVQATVGRAEARHGGARAYLADAMQELMAATDVGGDRLVKARVTFRTACALAAETAGDVIGMLAAEAGASAIFEELPLERAARDVHAATKHVAMNANSYIVAGRVHLGLEPGTARF
jgi:indole-3-acetate monooxygenase